MERKNQALLASIISCFMEDLLSADASPRVSQLECECEKLKEANRGFSNRVASLESENSGLRKQLFWCRQRIPESAQYPETTPQPAEEQPAWPDIGKLPPAPETVGRSIGEVANTITAAVPDSSVFATVTEADAEKIVRLERLVTDVTHRNHELHDEVVRVRRQLQGYQIRGSQQGTKL